MKRCILLLMDSLNCCAGKLMLEKWCYFGQVGSWRVRVRTWWTVPNASSDPLCDERCCKSLAGGLVARMHAGHQSR
jgi:hypothetical protein